MKLFAFLFAAMLASPAHAAPTEKDAIALTEKSAAFLKDKGKDALMQKISAKDPEFVQGELYVDIRDLKTGVVLAHPYNPAIVGKDLIDVPDASGKKYRREIVDLAQSKGKGWVDYMYKNPSTGKIEPKTTYVLRSGDLILEAGIYKK
jgi:cytochrome c